MKHVAMVYDTLEELVHDKTVTPNMFINTLGNESIGDGYARGYVISEEEKEDSVKLDNGLYANPYITYSDSNLEFEKSLRGDEDNALKEYIKKTISELCEDIATEFVQKTKTSEETKSWVCII